MKKLYLCIFLLSVTCLTSCVDIEEQFDFFADGSCNVAYNFDMGKAVSVLVNLLPDSIKQSPQFSMVKDTSVNFYNILPDSVKQKMDSAQAGIAKTSSLHINMNLRQNIMQASIKHSADNPAALVYYLENISKVSGTRHPRPLDVANKKVLKNVNAQEYIIFQDYYSYEIGPHKFYRTIDKKKFNQYVKDNQAAFNLSKAMLIEMPYKVVINFAEPVKKVDGSKAVLSANKRSVIIQTTIEDVFKNPDVMNFKIDF